ncbi:MAG: hypothetical protein NVSMB53_15680 [Gemmatimonadaceae bacterium]
MNVVCIAYTAWLKSVQLAVKGYPGVLGPERSQAQAARILSLRVYEAIERQGISLRFLRE